MTKFTAFIKVSSPVLLLAGLLVSSASFASFFDKWPEIPSPPESKVAWVAQNMTQNGVPMKIQNFSSRLGVKEITDYYMSAWTKGGGQKPVINEAGEWTVVGKIDDGYLLTVQAKRTKNGNGSEGFLAVSTLLASAKSDSIRSDTTFPRLPGTKMLSDTRSMDEGRFGKTLMMKNNHSVRSNASFYKNNLKSKGWSLDPATSEVQRLSGNNAYLYFSRNDESITMTITRIKNEFGSSIIVNISNTSA